MLKKIRELFKNYKEEKGQGTVEYALILGFVAILAVYLLTGSGLTQDSEQNVKNADSVLKAENTAFGNASGSTATPASPTVPT